METPPLGIFRAPTPPGRVTCHPPRPRARRLIPESAHLLTPAAARCPLRSTQPSGLFHFVSDRPSIPQRVLVTSGNLLVRSDSLLAAPFGLRVSKRFIPPFQKGAPRASPPASVPAAPPPPRPAGELPAGHRTAGPRGGPSRQRPHDRSLRRADFGRFDFLGASRFSHVF